MNDIFMDKNYAGLLYLLSRLNLDPGAAHKLSGGVVESFPNKG